MGYPAVERAVCGPDGWPLSGATHGSVAHLDRAIGLLHSAPEDAVKGCGVALRLAPCFVMAHIVMAHALKDSDPAMGRAANRLLAWLPATDREKSHLAILGERLPGPALHHHLRRWPGDSLASSLLREEAAVI
ncbi:hypothetical protein [Pseudooceanicola sp.]|uniref:hypothetical protein n=1 Tax=Pseudooceanicola sp. TaxID=1914328 RepID=UPI0035C6683F